MFKNLIVIILLLSCVSLAQQTKLSSLGPNGGIISFIKGTPGDEVMFAVVRENGLYRSTDGGESWTAVSGPNLNLQSIKIGDITFHPQSSDTVLMATTIGLYRSSDKGLTWALPTFLPSPKYSVEYAPANLNVMFGSDDNGVLRSNDAGKTWTALKDNNYFGNRPIYKIAIHPNDVTNFRVIASTGFDDTVGIFISSNSGQTWKPFNKNLPTGPARRVYSMKLDTTGMGNTNFRVIIGTADGMYGTQTVFDSAWNKVTGNSSTPFSGVITSGLFVYDRFNALNNEHLFSFFISANSSEYDGKPRPASAQNGLFRIDSRFNTIFNPISPVKRVFTEIYDITSIFVPIDKDKKKIYIGTTAGIYVSTDAGDTWQPKNIGIDHSIIRNLTSLSQNISNKVLFAGMYGGGVFRSTNDGVTWNPANNGLTNPYITTVAVDLKQNYLFAGSAYTLYKSTNSGIFWTPVFTVDSSVIINNEEFTNRNHEMTVRISPLNSNLILLDSKAFGLRLSTNGGISWNLVQIPSIIDSSHPGEQIEFDPIDSVTIYIAGKGLHKSTNLGQSWIDISGNLPKIYSPDAISQMPIQTISPTINPKNTKEIFISTIFDVQNGLPFTVFKTVNGGVSWDSLLVFGYDVIFDKFDGKKVIASGPYGIYGSNDGGSIWKSFSDPLQQIRYFLINSDASNPNIFYIGSEKGAHKLEFTEYPKLTIDTTDYNFGSLFVGKDSIRTIRISNKTGSGKLYVQLSRLTDTVSFRYLGSPQIEIPAGGELNIPVRYVSLISGQHTAQLRFETNDLNTPFVVFNLRGHTFTLESFDRFIYDFGSVAIGKDSTLSIPINNNEGLKPIRVIYLGISGDTDVFDYASADTVDVDSGKTSVIAVKFSPKSKGDKLAYIGFTTSDPRLSKVVYRLKGVGVARNFITRKVLIDTAVGRVGPNGASIDDYYKNLSLSLRRADITVHHQKTGSFGGYNALVYVQPKTAPPKEIIDSLQRYVNNGGTLVLMGDFGSNGNQHLTAFLEDPGWVTKYKTKTGIKFNTNMIVDSTFIDSSLAGIVIAKPLRPNLYTYAVDSVIAFLPGSLSIDTSLKYVEPLLFAKSSTLYSVNPVDSTFGKIPSALLAAYTTIGKGKIIAVADYDIWWNGFPEDTTKPFGVFGGKNLQFAFNIFGLVDNLLALLAPTPQEEYEMISIPYSFADSSVEALFKDLGKPNKLLWRMFGRYDQRKGYSEFPDDFKTIRRGEGYWLISKNDVRVNLGTTSVQGTENDFEIALHPGYNMIGNPFPYKISWKDSFREDSVESVIWSYNKGVYDSITQNMEPFQGYWVKNRGKLHKVIRISSTVLTSPGIVPKNESEIITYDPNEWKIQLSAQSPRAVDSKNFIGVLNSSVDGLDENDFSEPPAAPVNYLSVSIKNTEGRLAADYREFNKHGHYWDLDISSGEPSIPLNITLTKFGMLTPGFKIYLLDNKQERVYDMTSSTQHSLKFEKNELVRSFRIIVGTEQFVEQNTNGIPIVPMVYSLSQNYPNPFNPTTTIHYSLSHSAAVTLEIFNVLGQKVTSLINEFQPIGVYIVNWDGKDEQKKGVATGVYYYRLHANEFSSIKKMTLIK